MTHNSEKTRQLDFLNSKEVAQMLGVNVSTIKRWTQSGKLPCQTTAGGHRRFMMADLINLVNENKSAIVKSNVFRLESEEDARISYHVVKRDYDFLKGFVIKQALEGRSEKVQQILSGLYMVRSPLHEIYDDLLTPVLWELGDRWDRGDVSIIEEHIASQTLRDCTVRLQGMIEIHGTKVGRALLLVPSTELHDIALKMADHLLEEAGYETHFSGQMSPLVKIERIFEKFRPHRLYISVTYIENIESTQQEIDKLFAVAASYNTAIFVGGRGFDLLTLPGPAQRIEHFSQLIAP